VANRTWHGSKWIRRDKRLAIYLRDGFRCIYCRADLTSMGEGCTLDHVTPVELGGDNSEGNLVTACKSCNSAKRDLPLSGFLNTVLDRGAQPVEAIRNRVRRNTRRKLDKYRQMAKETLR
jgi:5-methylcytosine-specific restriction endonuclease McrA